ncbi:MAG: glycosyltransferase, partial [Bacteroides sp.]
DCNAHDALRAGAGVVSDEFDLGLLLESTEHTCANPEFYYWASSSERRFINELERLGNPEEVVEDMYLVENFI